MRILDGLINESSCIELNAADLILKKGKGKKIAIVGHFPFIPKVSEASKKLWVIEKNPREGDFTESEGENFIPQSDVVGITGTALTNHTLDRLLDLCNPKAYVVSINGKSWGG